MTRLFLAAVVAASALHTTANAQDFGIDQPAIIVAGEGEAERDPDQFTVSATVRGQGADQVTALRQFEAVQTRVTDGLRRLPGLTSSEVTTGPVAVTPIHEPGCVDEPWMDPDPSCTITGYVAEMSVKLVGSPVDRAGDAASLAAELGAHRAAISGFSLREPAVLRDEAVQRAFADARHQADMLAATSGQRITRVLKIISGDQYGSPVALAMYAADAAAEAAAAAADAAAPAVTIDLAPEPISHRASVMVAFEIE